MGGYNVRGGEGSVGYGIGRLRSWGSYWFFVLDFGEVIVFFFSVVIGSGFIG